MLGICISRQTFVCCIHPPLRSFAVYFSFFFCYIGDWTHGLRPAKLVPFVALRYTPSSCLPFGDSISPYPRSIPHADPPSWGLSHMGPEITDMHHCLVLSFCFFEYFTLSLAQLNWLSATRVFHLLLTGSSGRYCCSHFSEEKTEARNLSSLPTVTQEPDLLIWRLSFNQCMVFSAHLLLPSSSSVCIKCSLFCCCLNHLRTSVMLLLATPDIFGLFLSPVF